MRIGNIFKRKVVALIIAASKVSANKELQLSDIGNALYSMLIDDDELAYMRKKPRLFTWARSVTFKGRSLSLSEPLPFPSNVPELSDESSEYIDSMLEEFDAKAVEAKEEHDTLYAAISKCSTLKALISKEPNIFPFVVKALDEELTSEGGTRDAELAYGIPPDVLRILQNEGVCDDVLIKYLRKDTSLATAEKVEP